MASVLPLQAPTSGTLSLLQKYWFEPEVLSLDQELAELGVPRWVLKFLEKRDLGGQESLKQHLQPRLADLPDPESMADLPKAVKRLADALEGEEAITVWGDYDVDGTTACSVMVDFLRRCRSASVFYHIPSRRDDGYGLNADGVREIAKRGGVMITVDCGISAHDELALAKELGLDVIVCDHHQVPQTLPVGVAMVNPHREDCAYPFSELCAAGVAFMLAIGLRRELRARNFNFAQGAQPDLRELLDIVALATVADMVPMFGVNRTLVATGLRCLQSTKRPGIVALMKVSGIDPSRIDEGDLGFRIGPRINARGRLESAEAVVQLLLTQDPNEAARLAAELDSANGSRREIEQDAVDAAIAMVEEHDYASHAAIVVAHPSWHPGVVGLVASRLAGRYHRPTICIGEGGKGSGRSACEANLHQALSDSAEYLLQFGGHVAAAGLRIEEHNLAAFRQSFVAAIEDQLGVPPYFPKLHPDFEVEASFVTLENARLLARLGPFGMKHRPPSFLMRKLKIENVRIVGQDHLKLSFGGGIDAIAFRMGDFARQLGEYVDVVFALEENIFRGQSRVQMRLEDIRPSS